MAAAAEEETEELDEEEEEQGYPAELDDFLEYCVEEYGLDFERISADFIDIASGLEEPLVSRAQDFFSPQALQRRWYELSGEGEPPPEVPDATAAPAAVILAPEVAAGSSADGASAAASAAAGEASAAAAPAAPAVDEPVPSGFSIFTDSLKTRMDQTYAEVQNRLPTTLGDSASSGSDNDGDLLDDLMADGGDGGGDNEEDAAAAKEEIKRRARELFGEEATQMFPESPSYASEAAGTPLGASLAAQQSPARGAAAAPAAPLGPASRARAAEAAAAAGAREADGGASSSEAGSDSADEDFAALRQKMKSSSNAMASAHNEDASPSNGASGRRPLAFAPPARTAPASAQAASTSMSGARRPQPQAARKFVKLELVETSDEDSDESQSKAKGSGSEEDAEDENDEEEAAEGEGALSEAQRRSAELLGGGLAGGLKEDNTAITVISRLLRKAPDGECAWDVWLEAVRRHPRMQVALGAPEFFRRGGGADLRVSFDVEKLKELLAKEKLERNERRERLKERREKLKNGVDEFVREAERRREMLGGRFRGGFVLASKCPALEEKQEEARRKKRLEEDKEREAESAKENKRRMATERAAEQEQAKKEREEALRVRKQEEEERKRKKDEEERARKLREEREKVREERLEVLRAAVKRQRCPLYDRNLSHGPAVGGLSSRLSRASADTSDVEIQAYLLPWGTVEGGLSSASSSQQEVLGLAHDAGCAEGLMLLPAQEVEHLLKACGPEGDAGAAAYVLLLLAPDSSAALLQASLADGRAAQELLLGPARVPAQDALAVFRRPLALWAAELSGPEGGCALPDAATTLTDTVCVVLGSGRRQGGVREGALRALLAETQSDGLVLVGARLVFPSEKACEASRSAALRSVLRPGCPSIVLALRGPHALSIWANLLGPADPALARRTDPSSLSARFGGSGREEAVATAPPSSASKGASDVIWAFGGRVEDDDDGGHGSALPQHPVHALVVEAPRMYRLRIFGLQSFGRIGALLNGLMLRAGQILDIGSEQDDTEPFLSVLAVREGGGSFVTSCDRLLHGRAEGGGSSSSSTASASRKKAESVEALPAPPVATRLPPTSWRAVLAQVASPARGADWPTASPEDQTAAEEHGQDCEPEVLVVALRPRADTPLAAQQLLEDLHAKFGRLSGEPGALHVGLAADLMAIRALDLRATASANGRAEALAALRDFRNFRHLVRRIADEPVEGWWEAADGSAAPLLLCCLRGEDLIARFRAFLAREWRLVAATSGDVFYAPTAGVAHVAWSAFFGPVGSGAFAPTWPAEDLRSSRRFDARGPEAPLRESALFPWPAYPPAAQVTCAVLLPPTVDALLFRALSAANQHGFTLRAAVVAGGLRHATARRLFDQEVADGQLSPEDWEAFRSSVGRTGDGDEDVVDPAEFRCIWLVLSRRQGVKRFAQLCGHGDPAVNQRHLSASLRHGKSPVQNGVRCATSVASAAALLGDLDQDLAPWLRPVAPPAEGRGLGVEAGGARTVECTLVVAVGAVGAELSGAQMLRDIHNELLEKGLTLVGLRLGPVAAAPSAAAGAGGAGGSWPRGPPCESLRDQLRRWVTLRPAAQELATRALDGQGCGGLLLVAACEGPQAVDRARFSLASLGGRSPRGGGAALAWYTSATTSEAATDVPHFFHELFGGRHYIV